MLRPVVDHVASLATAARLVSALFEVSWSQGSPQGPTGFGGRVRSGSGSPRRKPHKRRRPASDSRGRPSSGWRMLCRRVRGRAELGPSPSTSPLGRRRTGRSSRRRQASASSAAVAARGLTILLDGEVLLIGVALGGRAHRAGVGVVVVPKQTAGRGAERASGLDAVGLKASPGGGARTGRGGRKRGGGEGEGGGQRSEAVVVMAFSSSSGAGPAYPAPLRPV